MESSYRILKVLRKLEKYSCGQKDLMMTAEHMSVQEKKNRILLYSKNSGAGGVLDFLCHEGGCSGYLSEVTVFTEVG